MISSVSWIVHQAISNGLGVEFIDGDLGADPSRFREHVSLLLPYQSPREYPSAPGKAYRGTLYHLEEADWQERGLLQHCYGSSATAINGIAAVAAGPLRLC